MTTAVAAAVKTLDEALAFEAPEIPLRFARDSGVSREDADYLFTEAKRWLWACAARLRDGGSDLLITPELTALDRMWHCFILFTADYERFCHERLGTFIHHKPITSAELERFEALRASDPKRALAERQAQLKPQLEYLFELLGPDALREWYQILPSRFADLKS